MKERDFSEQRKYWLNQFQDNIPVINLPISGKRDNSQRDRGKTINRHLSGNITEKLKK